MVKIKDTIWLLKLCLICILIIVVGLLIIIFIQTKHLKEARNDANAFFDEAIELKEYKDTRIRSDALKSAKKAQEWELLIKALIIIETEGQSNPETYVGDNGQAVGVLQLHPCVIEDVQMAGYDYSLNDRLNRDKSIEIWKIWMEIWNPEKDIWKAIKKHNPRLSYSTNERIIKLMQIIQENDTNTTTESK